MARARNVQNDHIDLVSGISADAVSRTFEAREELVHQRGRRVIPVPFVLTVEARASLRNILPSVRFVPEAGSTDSCHNGLQALRLYDEMLAYELCREFGGVIVDIGGNRNRHARHGRDDVHSCNPILDQTDAVRSSLIVDGDGCACDVMDCKCVEPDIYLSIHSLYYLEPDQIAILCQRATSRKLVAVLHLFPEAYGEFLDEAWYRALPNDRVEMHASLSSHAYVHSNMHWLSQGGYALPSGTLCWQAVRGHSVTATYVFTHIESSVPTAPRTIAPSGASHVTILGLPYLSWRGGLIGCSGEPVVVPKTLLDQLEAYMIGRMRNEAVYSNLLAKARTLMSKYRFPKGDVTRVITVAAAHVFINGAQSSIQALQAVEASAPFLAEYNRLASFKPEEPYRLPDFLAVTGFITAGLWWTKRRVDRQRFFCGYLDTTFKVSLGLNLAFGAAATAAFILTRRNGWRMVKHVWSRLKDWWNRPKVAPTLPAGALAASHDREELWNCRNGSWHLTGVERLRSHPPALSQAEIDALPVGRDKTMIIIEEHAQRPIARPIAVYGIVSYHTVSVGCFDYSQRSVEAALKARMLMPTGDELPGYNAAYVGLMLAYTSYHMGDYFPLAEVEQPRPIDDFLRKFPPNTRRMLTEAERKNNFGVEDNRFVRGLFLKGEMYTKLTVNGWGGTKPRIIQSGTPEHNIIVGPWIAALQEAVAAAWGPRSNSPWVFSCKGNARDYGARLENHVANFPDVFGRDVDASVFDGHVYKALRHIVFDAYHHISGGAALDVCEELDAGIPTHGRYSRHCFIVVKTPDGVHSGNFDTSLGNSLINVFMDTFCIAAYMHRDRCLFCGSPGTHPLCWRCEGNYLQHGADAWGDFRRCVLPPPSEVMDRASAIITVSGDDNNSLSSPKYTPTAEYTVEHGRRVGFTLKVSISETNPLDNLTYCSCRYYPSSIGRIMAPKLGRIIARFGFWYNPPNFSPEVLSQMCKADAIGRLKACAFVPFARCLVRRVIALSNGVTTSRLPKGWTDEWVTDYSAVEPVAETWAMLDHLYGLTPEHEAEYERLLSTITALPAVVNFAPFRRCLEVDLNDSTEDSEPHW